MMPQGAGDGEVFPRYVFVETLLPGRRVLELGAVELTSGRSALLAKEKGATWVLSLDDSAEAVAQASARGVAGVEYRRLDGSALPPSAFDLVMVHRSGWLDAARLEWLAKALSPSGHLVVVARRRGPTLAGREPAPDDSTATLLGRRYPSVERAIQNTFLGYAVAATTPETETTLDESMAGEVEAAFELFLCGQTPTGIQTVTLVPLPPRAVMTPPSAAPPAPMASPRPSDPLGLSQELESDLQGDRVRELEHLTQQALEEAERAQLALAQAFAERDHLRSKLDRSGSSATELTELRETLASTRQELVSLTQMRELEASLRHQTEVELEQVRADAAHAAELARAEVARGEQEVARLTDELADSGRRLASLSDQLQSSSTQEAAGRLDAEQELMRKQAELERQQRLAQSAELKLEAAQAELSLVRERHDEQERAALRAQAQLDQAIAAREEATRELEASREQVSKVTAELETTRSGQFEQREQSERLRIDLEVARAAQLAAAQSDAHVREQVAKAQAEAAEAREAQAAAVRSGDEWRSRYERTLEALNKSRAQEERLQDEARGAAQAAERLDAELKQVRAELARPAPVPDTSAAEATLRAARAEAASATAAKAELEQTLARVREALKHAEQEVAALRSQRETTDRIPAVQADASEPPETETVLPGNEPTEVFPSPFVKPAGPSSKLRSRCARMMMVGFPGVEAPRELDELVTEGVFGAILFNRNIENPRQVASLCRALKRKASRPFLLAVDQEGGRVARLKGHPFTPLPPMRELGRSGDEAQVERVGRLLAHELRAVGLDWDFAPVLDVDTNPLNPVIGDRAFSSEAEVVARLGVALGRGLELGGVASCGKHFPGHGDTQQDSHLELPRLAHDLERLRQVELLPFRAYAKAQLAAIMTAHVVFEAVDPGVPATMSQRVLQGILREELRFNGVIVSDDLEMKSIAENFFIEDAVVEAAAAGVDLFLVCHRADVQLRAIEALVRATESGRIPRERIEQANQRLDKLEARFAHAPADLFSTLGGAEHQALAAGLATSFTGRDPTMPAQAISPKSG